MGALAFGLNVFLARFLFPSEFGRYQFAITCGALAALIQDAGFRTLIFREEAGASRGFSLPPLSWLFWRHLLPTTAFFCFLALVFGYTLLLPSTIYFAFFVWCSWISSCLKGRRCFLEESGSSTSFRLTTVLCGLFLASRFSSANGALWGLALGGALWGLVSWKMISGLCGRTNSSPFRVSLRKLYAASLSFLLIDLFTTIYFRMDIVMLNYFRSSEEVAYYAASYRLFEAVIFASTPLMHIYFAYFRPLFLAREKESRPMFFFSLAAALFIAAGLLFVAILGREKILTWLYGMDYLRAKDSFVWLMFALLFALPNYILTQTVIASAKERLYVWAAAGTALFNFVANCFLIPLKGGPGAAITTFLSEALLFFCLLICGRTIWGRKWQKS